MTTPELAAEIVRKVSAAVEHPTTVKFRKGVCRRRRHRGRFRSPYGRCRRFGGCGYAARRRNSIQGCADWDVIAREGRRRGAVIGNGDVTGGRSVCARGANGLRRRDDWSRCPETRGCSGRCAPPLNSEAAPALRPNSALPGSHRHAEVLSRRIGVIWSICANVINGICAAFQEPRRRVVSSTIAYARRFRSRCLSSFLSTPRALREEEERYLAC